MKTKTKALRVGPCGVAQGCKRNCEGWAPHPTYADVWQTCWCGHSRGVHAIDLPAPVVIDPEPPEETVAREPSRCPCCGQPLLPEETS